MSGSGNTPTKPMPAPRKGRKQKEPNFSLSSRKENLSPREFALHAEQRLETPL